MVLLHPASNQTILEAVEPTFMEHGKVADTALHQLTETFQCFVLKLRSKNFETLEEPRAGSFRILNLGTYL